MVTKSMTLSRQSHQAHLRNALQSARGRAEQVIVTFVDVRSFSAFSSIRDSVDIGLYVRRLFLSLIDVFFPHASYYKSTGDGMMIIYPYDETDLARVSEHVIEASMKLQEQFAELAASDNMITFETPKECGIGINRGTVCCIESNGETLEYSGHVCNLAARLMDLARPAGIVMHASLGNMIPKQFVDLFEVSSVYVRGIAEHEPIRVYSLKGSTSISASATSRPH
jgi:class 3 adenylate cyclase